MQPSTLGTGLDARAEALTAHRPSLNALTGIRFFAAAYVILFHAKIGDSLLQRGYLVPGNFLRNGFLAVPLFFILSGFILAYSYTGQIETAGDRRRFLEARFARIWPLYALSLVFISIPGFRVPAPGAMVATVLMLQAWNPFDLAMAGVWNPVCWTLSCELFFYLCFPVLQTLLERMSTRVLLFVLTGVLALCLGANSAARALWYTPHGVYRYLPLPFVHLPEFLAGVVAGNLFLKSLARGGFPGRGLLTYIAAFGTLGLLCRSTSPWTSLVVPSFLMLVYTLAAERTHLSLFLASRLLVLGGGMSYAMYLTQLAVKIWATAWMDRLQVRSVWLRLPITMLVLLGLAYLLFKGFENPARKFLRSNFERLEKRRTLAS